MITAISDTASWVAWYRALESARPDKLFDDPWAAALAGERGRAIADSMRGLRDTTGVIAVRTAFYKKPFAASGIAVRFGVEDSSAFFAELGFAEVESRSTIHEAYKLQRLSRLYTWMIALTQLFAGTRHTIARSSRVVRFERRHVSA